MFHLYQCFDKRWGNGNMLGSFLSLSLSVFMISLSLSMSLWSLCLSFSFRLSLSLSLSLPATFSRARGKVESPIRGEQFEANRNAMIEDKWCNGEHNNNGPCSGRASPRPRNNEDRQRELNHNEDDSKITKYYREIFFHWEKRRSTFSLSLFFAIFFTMFLESMLTEKKNLVRLFIYLFIYPSLLFSRNILRYDKYNTEKDKFKRGSMYLKGIRMIERAV